MNTREAKREACWRAASALTSAMAEGWPLEQYQEPADGEKVSAAMLELIAELERRGSAPAP